MHYELPQVSLLDQSVPEGMQQVLELFDLPLQLTALVSVAHAKSLCR